MIQQILDSVSGVWDALGIGESMPPEMHLFLQSRRRTVFFLFAPGNMSQPVAVVKMSRHPAQNDILKQSVKRCQEIRQFLDPGTRATVPGMCLIEPINGLVGVVEQGMRGRPIGTFAGDRNREKTVREECNAFAEWLIHFQAYQRNEWVEITDAVLSDILLRPLEQLASVNEAHRSWLNDRAKALLGVKLPLVWAYGDAHPSNILLSNGRVSGVVDWEGAAPNQLPVSDWFQFSISLAKELIKAQSTSMSELQRTSAACAVLLGEEHSRVGKIIREETTRFFSAIGLSPDLAAPLFFVFLIGYYWFPEKESLVTQVLAGSTELPAAS